MNNKFSKSEKLLKRALELIPAGAQTYSKSYKYFSGDCAPYFFESGKGSHVFDVDGNEYIDFILGLGPVTVGYNNEEINQAVTEQLSKGISFSQPCELEIKLSEKLVEIIPSAEMVKFVKNGSDATSAAVRLARAATGRDIIAVCGYHGMNDWYIGSTSMNEGVPACTASLTKTFEYNNIESLKMLFDENPGQIAGVILEPVQGDAPVDDFLVKLRNLCTEKGTVLIFDEVVSGFRIALGGGQEYYGVTPDMTAVGKGMGNGLPLSAVVGKKEIMKHIENGAFISTTFGGEALSLAGSLKTIEILSREGSMKHIWKLSSRLLEESVEMMKEKNLLNAMSVYGLAPHSGFLFKDHGKLNSIQLLSVYQQALLRNGILSLGINNFCLAHSDSDIDRHLEAVERGLEDVKTALEQDSVKGILKGPEIRTVFKRN